jgi:hypothetical protein
MTVSYKMLRASFGFLFGGALLTAMAVGQCGTPTAKYHKQSWRVNDPASLLTQTAATLDPLVGMWHVTLTAEGNVNGPPDGTPIDNALIVEHSDGTEIMNSGRPPQDGDFCMGVWKKTGSHTYKVNHFAWGGNDTTNPGGIGNPQGPTRIVEQFTLSADGNSCTGTFQLRATDTSGNVTADIIGTIAGTRVTIDTTIQQLL